MPLSQLNHNIQRTLNKARVVATVLPLCPNIKLYLLDPTEMNCPFSADDIQAVLDNTPYWTFCWASGQAMACHILQNRHLFRDKTILDFGSGSGVVAIAAAVAGAAQVWACDLDQDALTAIKANAELNNVELNICQAIDSLSDPLDIIIAADVLYDRQNLYFLDIFLRHAPEVFVADSRIKTLEAPTYRKITEMTATTVPDLDESDEFRQVNIYRACKE